MMKNKLTLIEQKYQDLANCIKSDQLSARQLIQEFEDKKFKKWYRKRYEEETEPGLW